MADTILGNFPNIECSDCVKIGNVIYQHWGPLVPNGITGFFCKKCMQKRVDFSNKNGYAKPMLTIKELEFRQMSGDERKEKIAIIQKRLEEYKEHKNDAYAYFQGEIGAVRELKYNSPEDIGFLLMEIGRLNSVLDIILQK